MTAPLQHLYVQCNPLLDISAVVDEAFLRRYKVEKASATLYSDEQEGIFEALEQRADVVYVPGGSGLNTARVAQWMSRAGRGEFVTFVGCIARDKYGDKLRDAAEADGVVMEVEYTTAAPTGSCAVCVCNKERSLVANLAAANALSSAHMQSAGVLRALAASRLFYVTGFTLTLNVDYVLQVARAAHAAVDGGVFAMNLSAPFIVQFFSDNLRRLLPYVDVLFGNEDEARALAKLLGYDEAVPIAELAQRVACELPTQHDKDKDNTTSSGGSRQDDDDAAAAVRRRGARDRLVVFTQGSAPTVWARQSGAHGSVAVPPIAPEKIVDTNGGGDAFVGGFLAAWARGRDVARCCEVGNYAAGVVIQHDGCTYPPTPDMTP